MNIEVQQPKLEALIQERMASGYFETIEDALVQALESSPLPTVEENSTDNDHLCLPEPGFGQKLVDAFAQVRGLTDDVNFGRSRSLMRPLDVS